MLTRELRNYEDEMFTVRAEVQLPETLAEVGAVLDTLPEHEVIEMWNSDSCLGARVIAHYNPNAERIAYGYTNVDLTVEDRRFYSVELPQGQARNFFDWLFRESGISKYATETTTETIHREAFVCPCGNPDCAANSDAYDEEETESHVTVRGLRAALAEFASRKGEDIPDSTDTTLAIVASDN